MKSIRGELSLSDTKPKVRRYAGISGHSGQDDELVILPRVLEFIKLIMWSILLNPVDARLSVFLSARPSAYISSGAKGCIGSWDVSFERGRPEDDIFAIR
ncbi:hypothetical protein TNCV_2318631 [Trichonephila clavipes]|nr:hypothetical protein TNCV_2318631 [Trichonephila clavipes]